MIALVFALFSFAHAQPCCGKDVGVSEQLKAMQSQFQAADQCIVHDPRKTIKDEVSGLSDEEVMARLVLAETYATNCTGDLNGVMSGIATIIANRVKHGGKTYGTGIRGVVFHPSQFNSSLSTSYSRSQYKRFLCPVSDAKDEKQASMWAEAKTAVTKALAPGGKNFFGSDEVTMTYYYKHFPAGTHAPPQWASLMSKKRVNVPTAPAECIGFFRQ